MQKSTSLLQMRPEVGDEAFHPSSRAEMGVGMGARGGKQKDACEMFLDADESPSQQ